MLDIKRIREDSENIKHLVRSRGGDSHELIDRLLECDEIRRRSETEKQALQSKRNALSKEIGAK